MRVGATGFLLKSAPRDQLLSGIRGAAAGDVLLAPEVTRRLVERFVARPAPGVTGDGLERLTDRETEVLRLMAAGNSNAEIGAALHLAETTVKTHVSGVLSKLRLRDRVQAVVYAYESGLVEPGDSA
jgi:DNA-binding NarL/FixJ family response regulator